MNAPQKKTLERRQQLLEFIESYYGRKRIPPTLQEMALAVYGDERDFGNVSNALVTPLIEEGFLYRVNEGKYLVRNIMLTQPQPREFYYRPFSDKDVDDLAVAISNNHDRNTR